MTISSFAYQSTTCVEMGLNGVLGAGVKACGEEGSQFTLWDWCGGWFAYLKRGLPPQVRAFFYYSLTATQVLIIH
jgi:hypothetical protein